MKQELTFAALLLAIGSLLWFSSGSSHNPAQRAETVADLVALENDSSPTTSMNPNASSLQSESSLYPTSQASFQSDLRPDETTKPESAVQPGSNPLVGQIDSDFEFTRAKPDPDTIKMLANTANRLANSHPFAMEIRLEANMFGQHIVANGDYFQMGQGTHKTRIELTFESFKNQPKLTQVCDGRFFYTIKSNGTANPAEQGSATQNSGTEAEAINNRELEFVDLLRVQQAAGERATQLTPTGWVATGGLSSLLQHLASGFNFGPPESIGDSLIRIRGRWDENALRQMLANKKIDLGTPVDWNQVPKQLPHAVEFIFKQTPSGINIPKQVSFLRFVSVNSKSGFANLTTPKSSDSTQGTSNSVTGSGITTTTPLVLSFSDPRDLKNLADGFFVIDSSNLEPTDATDRYIARIESFHQTVAEQDPENESPIGR